MNRSADWLHLHHGQQSWGHGLGRSFRDLPPAVAQNLDAEVSDLEDRLRILDALCISPTAITIACRKVLPPIISAACKARMLSAMPVRLLTKSVLRWPRPEQVLQEVEAWESAHR